MGYAAALFVFLFVAAAEAKEYVVGGSGGWGTGVDYSSWASSNTFSVGDTLVFQYSALHTVNEVSESDYTACSASNAIQTYGTQNTRITLASPGIRYFICGTSGHCTQGMKLAVTVSASSSTSTSSGSSSTPTSSGSSSTPTSSGSSYTPTTQEGSITPPSTTTPYGYGYPPPSTTTPYGYGYNPYNNPYYYNSGARIRSDFYGLVFALFVVITLLAC